MTHGEHRARKPHYAFTLIELLVVVAIIAMLIAILLPSLKRARDAAKQARGASNLRQMMMGYSAYHADNRGWILYGYQPQTVAGQSFRIHDPDSGHTFTGIDGGLIAMRYPWRLLPYVANNWGVIYSHDPPSKGFTFLGQSYSDAASVAYRVALSPTFGINAVYVGGHFGPRYKGFVTHSGGAYVPNQRKHVVFREGEVLRPSELIVFADAKQRDNTITEGDGGFHWLTPPRAGGEFWSVHGGEFTVLNPGTPIGLPEGRYTGYTLTGFFDGHAKAMRPERLENMRLWANWADELDYDYAPP